MTVMCEQWVRRMEPPSLDIAPVFIREWGWGQKVLSLNSLSGPRRTNRHEGEVETTAVFHLLPGRPGRQLPPPQPSHTRAKGSSPSTRCKAPPQHQSPFPRAGLPVWSTVTSSASRQPGEVTSQFPSLRAGRTRERLPSTDPGKVFLETSRSPRHTASPFLFLSATKRCAISTAICN